MATYRIVRFFAGDHERETVQTGLTLEEAQEHCEDPESSSRTCTNHEGIQRTEQHGPWFEGYREE